MFQVMTQNLNDEQKNNVQYVINTGINKQSKLGEWSVKHTFCCHVVSSKMRLHYSY